MFIVVSQFLLTYERSRIRCLLLFHNSYYLTKGAAYNISLCPSIPTNSLKSKSGMQHALFLLSVYMIPIKQGESYSQVALLIRRLPSNRPIAMLMIYKLLSCYPILTKMKSGSKNKMALFLFFSFSVLLLFFFHTSNTSLMSYFIPKTIFGSFSNLIMLINYFFLSRCVSVCQLILKSKYELLMSVV